MVIALGIGLGCILLLEIIVKSIFPRPRLRREPQIQMEIHEQIGYYTSPNQKAFTVESPATINSFGFRGPELDPEKKPGSFRLLGLGNSLTFGSGVRDHETYLAYADKKLKALFSERNMEVINGAIIGFTIRQYIPFLKTMLPKVKPDVVLLGAHWRDLHFSPRFGQLKKNLTAQTWYQVQKKFKERIVKSDPPDLKENFLRAFKNFIRRWRTVFVAIHYFQVLKDRIKTPSFQQWQQAFLSGEETEPISKRRVETRKTLSRMKKLCEEQNAKFVIVIFPDFKQLDKVFPNSSWPSLLTEACTELDIPYFILLPAVQEAYKKYGKEILMPYDAIGHYNVKGHIAIGEALVEFLKNKQFFQDSQASKIAVAG